jgi:predicted amidohydrolase
MTARQYVTEVMRGRIQDPTLSFQLENGLVVLDVVADYLRDSQSRSYATLLEWLNPQYVSAVSLRATAPSAGAVERAEERAREEGTPRRVRIAAVQYALHSIGSFEDFARRAEFFAYTAQEYRSQFLLFPEYFTMQLLSYLREPSPGRAVRRLAQMAPRYEELFERLASDTGIYIVAGTHPIVEEGKLFNAAHLFTPHGRVFRQKKVHLTPTEKGPYQMDRGHGFYVYETEHGTVAILVCYDVEFPEAARVVAQAGAEILFVPSCTDDRQAYYRVRYCSQSRAIENQMYVAVTGTIGNLPEVPHMAANYGQAAILTPSDFHFARDGIAAEGTANQEQIIVGDVDLDLLEEQRINGSVIPLEDRIVDAYDHVIRCSDRAPVSTPPAGEAVHH